MGALQLSFYCKLKYFKKVVRFICPQVHIDVVQFLGGCILKLHHLYYWIGMRIIRSYVRT